MTAKRTRKAAEAPTSHRGERLPSEVKKRPWVYAVGPRGGSKAIGPGGGSGKWLLFSPPGQHDANWIMIKQATEAGLLGRLAKASTAMPTEHRQAGSDRLICVSTYDWQDKADVHRVLRELRALGFTAELPYKTDAATLAGRYGHGAAVYVSPPGSLDFEDRS